MCKRKRKLRLLQEKAGGEQKEEEEEEESSPEPKSGRKKKRRAEAAEAAATEKVNWDIVKFGRVLKIEHVQADPLHIEMLAKKSGPGNHSAVTCIVTREVLEEEMGGS